MNSSPQIHLVPCPDCAELVSARALACPRCGCPLQRIRLDEQRARLTEQSLQVGKQSLLWLGRAVRRSIWAFWLLGIAVLSLFLADRHELLRDGRAEPFAEVGLIRSVGAALYAGIPQSVAQWRERRARPDEWDDSYRLPKYASPQFEALTNGLRREFWHLFDTASSEAHAFRLRELALERQATWATISGCARSVRYDACSYEQGVISLAIAYFVKLLVIFTLLKLVFRQLKRDWDAAAP